MESGPSQPPPYLTVAYLRELEGPKPAAAKTHGQRWKSELKRISPPTCKSFLNKVLPVTDWLPKYQPKKDLMKDIFVGLTISVLHLPQGMAYGILAAMPAINGLYTSLFAPFFYFFFGTSRHVSIGTMAVVALMTGAITEEVASRHYVNHRLSRMSVANNFTMSSPIPATSELIISVTEAGTTASTSQMKIDDDDPDFVAIKVEVATSVTLLVGVIQLVLGLFRFGFVASFMSEALTRGFTTGCACYVFTSQLKFITGIKIKRKSGPFNLILTHIELWQNLDQFHWRTFLLGISMIALLYFVKRFASPYIKAKLWKSMPMPIPIDLFVIILCTLLSWGLNLEAVDMDTVGDIPAGLPTPSLPNISYWKEFYFDCIALSVVAYAIAISMAKIMAKRNEYQIDSNQELLAHGVVNAAASCFGCEPSSSAFSRTLLMDSMGAVSQLAGIVSSGVILVVLVAVGPYFKYLPKCTLGAIVMTALRTMFLQALDLPRLWRFAKYDFSIWVLTFLATVFLDVPYGLIVGVAFSLLTIAWRSQRMRVTQLEYLPQAQTFVEIQHPPAYSLRSLPQNAASMPQNACSLSQYAKTRPDLSPDLSPSSDVGIFRVPVSLFYANVESVKEAVVESVKHSLKTDNDNDIQVGKLEGKSKGKSGADINVDNGLNNASGGENTPEQMAEDNDNDNDNVNDITDNVTLHDDEKNINSPADIETGIERDSSKSETLRSATPAPSPALAPPPSPPPHRLQFVILDMSSVSFCDSSGVSALESIVSEMTKHGVKTLFANLTPDVVKTIVKSGSKVVEESNMYLNLGEAVRKTNELSAMTRTDGALDRVLKHARP